MQLYVVRHAQKRIGSRRTGNGFNPELTRTGEKQAEHLAKFFADQNITGIYSSCLLRSLETAKTVYEKVAANWHCWPVFCETSWKEWGERARNDAERSDHLAAWPTGEDIRSPSQDELASYEGNYYFLSDLSERFSDAKLSQPFPWPDAWWVPQVGQTREMGYARIEMGIQAMRSQHAETDTVVLVCHGNCANKILTTMLDMPRTRRDSTFAFGNTGITRVDGALSDNCTIKYTNRQEHLPNELRG